ncbi:MAG TPA: hydrogen gas-evolving membrane-bound hydrogenase subunit E [bacterium]
MTALTTALLALLVLCGAAAAISRNLFGSAMLLGTYSFVLAALWALWGGLDVAFTEAVVGAGVATIYFIALLWVTKHTVAPRPMRAQDGLLVVLAVALLAGGWWMLLGLPVWMDPLAPAQVHLSPEFLTRSLADTQTPNVVTSILADYRGFDTLMETTVIFTAAISCWLLGAGRE